MNLWFMTPILDALEERAAHFTAPNHWRIFRSSDGKPDASYKCPKCKHKTESWETGPNGFNGQAPTLGPYCRTCGVKTEKQWNGFEYTDAVMFRWQTIDGVKRYAPVYKFKNVPYPVHIEEFRNHLYEKPIPRDPEDEGKNCVLESEYHDVPWTVRRR